MDSSENDNRLAQLEARLASLERSEAVEGESVDLDIQVRVRELARTQALEVVVIELAVQLGISEVRIQQRLTELQRAFHDSHLQRAERRSSSFAAKIDDRDLDEVPTDQGSGPLFPPTND